MTITTAPKKQLFIIGNGFDLHHWSRTYPNTSYNAFAVFLKNNRPDIFNLLTQTCFLPYDTADALWAQFEGALADFEPEEIFEKIRNYIDDTNPHNFGAAGWEVKKYINLLTKNMAEALNEFISFGCTNPHAVKYPDNICDLSLPLPQDALYLSFNYTDTLERFYQIPTSQICYIHGKSGIGSNLMIGHGVDPLDHDEQPRKERYSFYEELRQVSGKNPWEDINEDHYSLSENLVREEIDYYWSKSFKDARSNIQKNKSFFEHCQGISTITIIGHSLSEVDLPYFENIKSKASSSVKWEVSFYKRHERKKKEDTLLSLGIAKEKISLFKLQDYTAIR